MNSSTLKQNVLLWLSVVLLRFFIDYIYVNDILTENYDGNFFYIPNNIKFAESVVLFLFSTMLLPSMIKKTSDFYIMMLYMFVVLPSFAVFSWSDTSREFMYFNVVFFAMFKYFCEIPFQLPLSYLPTQSRKYLVRALQLKILAWSGVLVTILLYIFQGGIQRINFDFSLVYEIREDTATLYNIGVMGYLTSWAEKVFVPFLLLESIVTKNIITLILLISVNVFLFAVSGVKSVLFFPIMLVYVYYVIKKYNKTVIFILSVAVFLSISLVLLEYFESRFIASYIVRRVFYIPAQLNFAYHEYFEHLPPLLFSNSFLSELFLYPYEDIPAKLVGNYIFGDYNIWANTSFVASSYMQLGLMGCIIYPSIAGGLLSFINMINKNTKVNDSLALSICSICVPMLLLIGSADLPTAFVSHGLILSMLFFVLRFI